MSHLKRHFVLALACLFLPLAFAGAALAAGPAVFAWSTPLVGVDAGVSLDMDRVAHALVIRDRGQVQVMSFVGRGVGHDLYVNGGYRTGVPAGQPG